MVYITLARELKSAHCSFSESRIVMQESMITRSGVRIKIIRNRRVIDMDKIHIIVRGNCENLIREDWSTIFFF
jgi:hypothetical protein